MKKKNMKSGHAIYSSMFCLKVALFCFLLFENSGSETTETKTCGETNPNNNVIDLSETDKPGPFHDLTTQELKQLRTYLTQDPNIKAGPPESASLNSSFVYLADLYVAGKSEILNHLDHGGPAPQRRARVVMFRGDKTPPVVEELVCGPLPDVTSCDLLQLKHQRNPVEFSLRPFSYMEFNAMHDVIDAEIDRKVGHILRESYGATFTNCTKGLDCLTTTPAPLGSGITKDTTKRLTWYRVQYDLPAASLHSLDFGYLVDSTSPHPCDWTVVKILYSSQMFNSFEELIEKYQSGTIKKTKVARPVNDQDLYSKSERRGDPQTPNPQRPPTLVEPDGKRYSVKDRKVQYMGWTFNFRSSSFTGPAVYDVRFKGERIAFEIALSDLAVIYNSHDPTGQTTNYIDSGALAYGPVSRSLVPGGDCPDSSTLIPNVFMSQVQTAPEIVDAAFCLFENNHAYPLRRYLSFSTHHSSFYAGMMDSCLTLRAAMIVGKYNYIVDIDFHQSGAIKLQFISTGYIQTVFYTDLEKPFGFHIHNHILGHIHHHLAVYKVDLDISGTSNRYETLDIHRERANLTAFPDIQFTQAKFQNNLKTTEKSSIVDNDFSKPKYHLIHNDAKRTNFNQLKGYRIVMNSASKSLLEEGRDNDPTLAWARHQMVVTKQKDDEISTSSIYGMYDGYNPALNFTSFYADDESIKDEDLVFWITQGVWHIPHTEDIPVTPSVGNHLNVFLLPYNYFPECPSIASRDAIFINLKDQDNPQLGVNVERYGNSRDQCLTPEPSLEGIYSSPEKIFPLPPVLSHP